MTTLSPIEKAELEAQEARSQFNYLQNIMMKTPEFLAVQKQREVMNKADEKVNLLKREAAKPKVDATISSLKEKGYECRAVYSHGYISEYVICDKEISEIGSLFSTDRGIEAISSDHSDHFYEGSDLLGCGDSEEEAWRDAVRNQNCKI